MTDKWSPEQINVLIDAYKKEPCLYAINSPHYRNKHLRTAALNRVTNAVVRLRPTATVKDCSNKFHNLRNQFNCEHSKVKSSLSNGTGTDDVYTPNLWYYRRLLFLESFVIPRRNRSSLNSEVSLSDVSLSQGTATHIIDENVEDPNCFENVEYMEDVVTPEVDEMTRTAENLFESSAEQAGTSNTSLRTPQCPALPLSPQRSSSSSSSSVVYKSRKRKRKNPRLDNSDEFCAGIKDFANSIKEPIVEEIRPTSSTLNTVDGFLTFLGSLLKNFQDEALQLEVMSQVTELVINAKRSTINIQKSNA